MESFHYAVGHGYVRACRAFGGLVPLSSLTRSREPFGERCARWHDEMLALALASNKQRERVLIRSPRREAECRSL